MTEIERLREALELILPMAKGYAHAHPVGSNAEYIASAEAALSSTPPAAEPTIPHPRCRTPGECRREEVCLDAWNCSAPPSPRETEGQE